MRVGSGAVGLLLGAVVFGAIYYQANLSLSQAERDLFSRIDAVLSEAEPQARTVVAQFALARKCETEACWLENQHVGPINFVKGDLRTSSDGLIFVLEEPQNTCIRTSRAALHYALDDPENSCSHKVCLYRRANKPWGFVSFGIDGYDAECVSSVVINSRS